MDFIAERYKDHYDPHITRSLLKHLSVEKTIPFLDFCCERSEEKKAMIDSPDLQHIRPELKRKYANTVHLSQMYLYQHEASAGGLAFRETCYQHLLRYNMTQEELQTAKEEGGALKMKSKDVPILVAGGVFQLAYRLACVNALYQRDAVVSLLNTWLEEGRVRAVMNDGTNASWPDDVKYYDAVSKVITEAIQKTIGLKAASRLYDSALQAWDEVCFKRDWRQQGTAFQQALMQNPQARVISSSSL